jgi:transformation/transcription domain-associated protein
MAPLPLSTQYSAVRTLLSLSDQIYHNKDSNPQIGRDMLCRLVDSLVDKLQALNEYFPFVLQSEMNREI